MARPGRQQVKTYLPRPVWDRLRREAIDAHLPARALVERAVLEALIDPPCICDYNRCDDEPCYGNCGCVACQRASE